MKSYKRFVGTLLMAVLLLLMLSGCGNEQPPSDQSSNSLPPMSGSADEGETPSIDANGHTDKLDLQMPTLSNEELLGTYDPNDVGIRLPDLIYILGIEIDSSKNEYSYTTDDDGDGIFSKHIWDVKDGDEALLDPPGDGGTYKRTNYDKNGRKVQESDWQKNEYGVGCTGIDVYEYNNNGEIKARYHFWYDDYEWEYLLRELYIYHGNEEVSRANFDYYTHKRRSIEVFAVNTRTPIKEFKCDSDQNPEYYYTYEYNINRDITKISKYDMSDNLEYYTIKTFDENRYELEERQYDPNDNLIKHTVRNWVDGKLEDIDISTFDVDGHLVQFDKYDNYGQLKWSTTYNWADDFSYADYETYSSSGSLIDSGRK